MKKIWRQLVLTKWFFGLGILPIIAFRAYRIWVMADLYGGDSFLVGLGYINWEPHLQLLVGAMIVSVVVGPILVYVDLKIFPKFKLPNKKQGFSDSHIPCQKPGGLFKPYKIISEDDHYTVYEFKTAYLYIMYGFLFLMILGWIYNIGTISFVGAAFMILYYLTVSMNYKNVNRKIKRATQDSSVEISGSKWSFTNPLRIKIKNIFL